MLIIILQLLQMSLLQIPRDARPPDQNIEPGTIVDTDVTSPEITEFYLNSHRALQVSRFCLFEIELNLLARVLQRLQNTPLSMTKIVLRFNNLNEWHMT